MGRGLSRQAVLLRWGAGIGIILLAALLRLPALSQQSIAFDESFSLIVSSADWGLLFHAILSDGVHPPLFYILHKIALMLWGHYEFGQRFMAAGFSLLGLPLIYQLARRMINGYAGLLAMALLAFSPLHVWLAQEARMYSLLSALTTLSMIIFWDAVRFKTRNAWLKLTVINALIFLIHYFGLLVAVIQLCYLIITFSLNHRALRPWALSQIGAGLCLVPWLVVTAVRPVQSFGIGFLVRPAPADLLLSLWNLTTGISDSVVLAILTLLLFAVAPMLVLFTRPTLSRQTLRRPHWLLICWGIVPLILVWVMSQQRSFYADRYFSFCIPALLLLAVYSVFQLNPRYHLLAVGSLIVLMIFSLVVMLQSAAYQKDDWRAAAAYVSQHQQPGDAVLLRSLHIKFAFNYYYTGQAEPVPVTVNLEEYDPNQLLGSATRAWLIFPYTRRPTHYPMQPPTDENVWKLDTAELPLLRNWFNQHQLDIIDDQRFLGIQIWLIKL